MKKNKIFYFLFKSIIMFLFLFIIELNAFDTIKNFFNKGIENLKKGYRWIAQKDVKADSRSSIAKIVKLSIANEENTKKENNEEISIINQESNPKSLLEEEKKSTKLPEILKKLLKNNSIENFNNPDFKNKFIKKYNAHIQKKNQNEDNQEKIPLLTEEEFNITLDNFKKKKKIATAIKKNIRTAIKTIRMKNHNFDTLVENLSSNQIIDEVKTESKIQEIENKNKEDQNISHQVASLIMPIPIVKTKKIEAIEIKKLDSNPIIAEIKELDDYIVKKSTINNSILNEKLEPIVL